MDQDKGSVDYMHYVRQATDGLTGDGMHGPAKPTKPFGKVGTIIFMITFVLFYPVLFLLIYLLS